MKTLFFRSIYISVFAILITSSLTAQNSVKGEDPTGDVIADEIEHIGNVTIHGPVGENQQVNPFRLTVEGQTWLNGESRFEGISRFNNNITFQDAGSYIQKVRGIYFTWHENYGTQFNHGIFSTYGTTYGDDITINSYGKVRINFDSNSNGNEHFTIGANTTGTGNTYFTVKDGGNVGIGTSSPSYKLHVAGDVYANGGWVRVSGTKGVYFQSYGGGLYMKDATWIRTYGNKSFYHNTGTMRTDGTFQVGPSGERFLVKTDGRVGIGITDIPSEYKLAVNGDIIATKVVVKVFDEWPDYVFSQNYEKLSLKELENFIQTNKHLPGVPSANEVSEEGVDLGEMNRILLQKVEELTLYILEQEKRIEALEKKND